jgi:hypothetical protein
MKNSGIKKIMGIFSMLTLLLIVGCKEQPAEKNVIIMHEPEPVIIENEVPKSSTSIKLDKNGLEVDAEKVNVKIE